MFATPMRMGPSLVRGLLILAVHWGAGGCDREAPTPGRPITLVVSADTDGWITPCGCTSNQSGGMLRRASFLSRLADRQVIYLDAGGAAAGTSAYHKLKFETVLRGERLMNVAAHNIGQSEAAFGADYLRETSKRSGVPLISANVRNTSGVLAVEPLRLVSAGRERLAIVGVLAPSLAVVGIRVDDPRRAVLAAIAPVKGKYDRLIVLAYLPQDQIEGLAAALPEADAIIGGPTGQPIAPHRVGPTLVISATNKGKFLARLDLDSSPASAWTSQIVEMDGKFPDDPQQVSVLHEYLARLGQLDLDAAQSGATAMPVGVPADYRVAGNSACSSCHAPDSQLWLATNHSHAWQTLKPNGFDADPFCRKCHTTGYGLPGGFDSWGRTPTLVSVGCESCHGPSQTHVRDPRIRTTYTAADQCVRCHDHENSPHFEFAAYWEKIRHGKPMTHAAGE